MSTTKISIADSKITAIIINDKTECPGNYGREFFEFDAPDLPTQGKKYQTWTSEFCGPSNCSHEYGESKLRWSNDLRMIEEGFPGNSDHSVRMHNGWRGTTDDFSVHAHGVRVCTGITRIEYKKTVHYKICFGPNLTPND